MDPYVRAMFGMHAIHTPLNLVVQNQGSGIVTFVGSVKVTEPIALRFGGVRTHQLIMGDAVIRPHVVIDSDHLQGSGLTSIVRDGIADLDAWIEHGNILLNPLSRVSSR